jgi:hypothetical protein
MNTKLLAALLALAFSGCATVTPSISDPGAERQKSEDAQSAERYQRAQVAMGIRPAEMTDLQFNQMKLELEAAGRESKNAEGRRREDYVVAHPSLAPELRDALLAGNIAIGMAPEDVIASWGRSGTIYNSAGVGGTFQSMDYGSMTLYFSEGRLVRWTQVSKR